MWHSIHISRQGREIGLIVNSETVRGTVRDSFNLLDVSQYFYLGNNDKHMIHVYMIICSYAIVIYWFQLVTISRALWDVSRASTLNYGSCS